VGEDIQLRFVELLDDVGSGLAVVGVRMPGG
jgi:hypothetical protein